MAVSPVSLLPTPIRGPGFIPVYVPPTVPQSTRDAFTRVLETSAATGAPLPSAGLQQALPSTDAVSLLQRSLYRDLVTSFDQSSSGLGTAIDGGESLAGLGLEGLLGRDGLPQALQSLGQREAASLYATLSTLLLTTRSLGGEEAAGPGIGSLLDLSV
ncbi:MAG: hypothetical protein KIT73_08490 [Burkholderiales bacterium]|nr:hypothetical protein [Burkholderiales bacterium]